MKTKILTLVAGLLLAVTGRSQVQLVDTNTQHWTGSNFITGDPLPVAFTKIDLSLTWLNNFCATNGTTNPALVAAVSALTTNLAAVSNLTVAAQAKANLFPTFTNWFYPDYTAVKTNQTWLAALLASFPGSQIQAGTVNSNQLDAATLAWLNTLAPAATMNFDAGTIISDGSGNASFVSIFAQQLKDSGAATGGADYYAKANGSGGWNWTAWPTALNYDGGTITSDGSGNLVATSFRGSLTDNSYSSGIIGYVPTANGDGSWTWTLGPAGSNGTNGLNGTNGTNGLNAAIVITNTVTGAAGSAAGVTNLGTPQNVLLRFTIPQGVTGANGANGLNGTNGMSVVLTNPVALPYGSTPTVTAIFTNGPVVGYQFGVPVGAPGTNGANGTNTVNYYNLSNCVVSANSYIALNTNFNFALSNALGKFTNVTTVYVVPPTTGGGGMDFGTVATYAVRYSTTGTNGWTTTLPAAPNILWLCVTSSATGAGTVKVTSIVNPNAVGNTNDLSLQTTYVAPATDGRSPVNLNQLSASLAGVQSFQSSGTNYYLSLGGQKMVELVNPKFIFSTNLTFAIDGTGTNWQVSLAASNRVAGAYLVMTTNLTLPGNGFLPYASVFTLTTNSGVLTYTLPMSAAPQGSGFAVLFQVATPTGGSIQMDYPLSLNGGSFYPSNGWNFASVTNGMADRSFWTVSSNGAALVTLWKSNTAVYYVIQSNGVSLKLPAP